MKKIDTSTRLLNTGPVSSWSESMALYNSLRINRVMLREEGKLAGQRSEIKDRIRIMCRDEMHRPADKMIYCLYYHLLLQLMELLSNSVSI